MFPHLIAQSQALLLLPACGDRAAPPVSALCHSFAHKAPISLQPNPVGDSHIFNPSKRGHIYVIIVFIEIKKVSSRKWQPRKIWYHLPRFQAPPPSELKRLLHRTAVSLAGRPDHSKRLVQLLWPSGGYLSADRRSPAVQRSPLLRPLVHCLETQKSYLSRSRCLVRNRSFDALINDEIVMNNPNPNAQKPTLGAKLLGA